MPLYTLPPKVANVLPASLKMIWLDAFNAALNEGSADCYAHAWAVALEEAFPGNDKVVLSMSDPNYSFAIDLAGMQFDDNADTVTWLQAMPLGTWEHPIHGAIAITPERVNEFANNVNTNVRGQDLDIDYDHKEKVTDAAGWIKGAQARSDGLWVGVQWTQSALAKLKDKAFRYFSPEFTGEWIHPSTNVKHKNVLFGGALTNRPFLKGILPINLSEVMTQNPGDTMLEEMRTILGLPDTATEAEVLAAAQTIKDAATPPAGTEGEPVTPEVVEETPPVVESVQATESAEVKKLNERIALLEAANRVGEVTMRLSELSAKPGMKFAIAPAALDQLKQLALDAPGKKFSDDLFKFAESVLTEGLVELGERGGRQQSAGNSVDGTATGEFMAKVEAHAKEKVVSFAEAANAISMSEPDLFDRYRNESYVRTRGEEV